MIICDANYINNRENATVFIKEKSNQTVIETTRNTSSINNDLNDAASVDISDEGKQLSRQAAENNKEAGITCLREEWEECRLEIRNATRKDLYGNDSIMYSFRIEDPEGYSEYLDLKKKAYDSRINEHDGIIEFSNWNESNIKNLYKALTKVSDFYRRKMEGDPKIARNALRKTAIDVLEESYSDSKHDFSINIFSNDENIKPKNPFQGPSLWRYSTKFNMLMSTDLLEKLTYGNDDDKRNILKVIDKSVNEMKDVEKAYSGNKEFLRFGITLDDNGNVSYHANYKDCSNPYGVEANSADKLLEMLMSDK